MKLKKLFCLLLTGAMLLSMIIIPASAGTTTVVGISYDISGNSAVGAGAKISHGRTYQEYKTGDDVSSLGAYTAHNMVFDGGKNDGTQTYLSPNPLAYWTGNTEKKLAIDYGGMGTINLDTADVSYIAYKVAPGDHINQIQVDIYGALGPSLNENKNGGWAQIAVYVFNELPTESNGRINFNDYTYIQCMGNMDAQPSYYSVPNGITIDEDALFNADVNDSCYVVLACLASGGILESVDDRLSGYGGQGGAPVIRLNGVTIKASTGGEGPTKFYVAPGGSDANDGKSYATAFATVEHANAAAAAVSPAKAVVEVDPSMLKLNVAKEYGTAKSASAAPTAISNNLPGVVFWGDSLTAGTATTGYDGTSSWNPYPAVFGKLVESNIIQGFNTAAKRVNMGVGGETAATIAGRANAIPVVLKSGVTIPASGKVAVSMALKGYSDTFSPLKQSGVGYSNIQDVTIKGVAGKLTFENGTGTYYFTRSTSGSAVTAAAGDTVTFVSGNEYDNTNYIPVVFMGYNDGADNVARNMNKYTGMIDAILNKYPQYKNNGRYVVVAPHFRADQVANVKTIENGLVAKYGDHVIKMREFLSTYGPYEAGITPSATDYIQMADGKVPNCLMSTDDTHYSAKGYELVARLIYTKMYELGYFDEVISALGVDTSAWDGGSVPPPAHTCQTEPVVAVPATCTTPGNIAYYKCVTCGKFYSDSTATQLLSASAVVTPKLGHNYVNGVCTRCQDVEKVNAKSLSFNYSYDCLNFGKRAITSCVPDAYKPLSSEEDAALIGAVAVHNVFVDGSANRGAMTYIHPGSYDMYDSSFMEAGNAKDADFTNPSTINGAYDFSYVAYRVSSGDTSKTIDTLKVNLYGCLWPSVLTGGLTDCRYQMAVYVMNELDADYSGKIDFGAHEDGLVFAKGDQSQLPSAYTESDCYKIDCASALEKLGPSKDVYIVVVLACTGWGVSADYPSRASGYKTDTSLRFTGIKVDATANGEGPTPPPAHEHTMQATPAAAAKCEVPGNTAYWYCTGCMSYFSDAAGQVPTTRDATVIPALNHDIHDNVVKPTATEWGYTEHKCSRCDYSTTDSYLPPDPNAGGEDQPTVKKGDANGDGQVDSDDALLILNYVMRPDLYHVAPGFDGDVTKDGQVDSDDALYLLNSVMRPDLYPLL